MNTEPKLKGNHPFNYSFNSILQVAPLSTKLSRLESTIEGICP